MLEKPHSFDAVVSFDLDWSKEPKAAASALLSGGDLLFTNTGEMVCPLEYLDGLGARKALVLLDIPVFGTENLSREMPFRGVDRVLLRTGIPLLPSYKAGNTGEAIAKKILCAYPKYRVLESYPYAILRFLWSIRDKPYVLNGPLISAVDRLCWMKDMPPKYKRAHAVWELRSSCEIVVNLIGVFLSSPHIQNLKPGRSAKRKDLLGLAHVYDSLIALIAGLLFAEGSQWSVIASVSGESGSILLMLDEWLKKWMEEICPRFKTVQCAREKQTPEAIPD